MQHGKLISSTSTKGNHPGEILRDDFLGPMKISVCVEELRADPEIAAALVEDAAIAVVPWK